MKKLYLIVPVALLLFVFTSCTKEYIAPQNTGQTIVVSVPQDAWGTNDGINNKATIIVPELTSYLSENCQVLVYLSFDNSSYELIPEIRNDISYSFSHAPGLVTIYAQDLDGTGIAPPPYTDVKIILNNGY